jgi:hypothetical protein
VILAGDRQATDVPSESPCLEFFLSFAQT